MIQALIQGLRPWLISVVASRPLFGFLRGGLEAVEGVEDGLLHGGMGEVAQMAALLEEGDLVGGKGGLNPREVVGGQEKIVAIEDQADIGIGVEAVAIGAEVAGFFE